MPTAHLPVVAAAELPFSGPLEGGSWMAVPSPWTISWPTSESLGRTKTLPIDSLARHFPLHQERGPLQETLGQPN